MTDRTSHRRWSSLLVVLAFVAGGCGLIGGDDDDDSAPRTAQPTLPAAAAVLRASSVPWPECLNPLTCADDAAARDLVLEHVLPKLMEVDATGRYVPSPVLSATPEVRVDAGTGEQTVTFALDSEARWHDGRPITSSDVTGTWMARQSTPGALVDPYGLITAIDDRDPQVARVTLSQASPDWPELFGGHHGWLLQPDAFGGAIDLTDLFEDELGFGAGPFQLASFDERAIVLTAREQHWHAARQAAVDQVRIERLPEQASGDLSDAVPGGIDLVVPGGEVSSARARFSAVRRPTTEIVGLFFDRRSPPLGSEAVRRAVDEAVDRRRLLDLLDRDESPTLVTCAGWLPQHPSCEDDLPESASSASAAAELLDADGWALAPEGTRGRPDLALLVAVAYDPSLPQADRAAAAVGNALEAVGFAVELQPTDPSTWRQGDRLGPTGIGLFSVDLATAADLAELYRCEEGAINPLGWCEGTNQELVDALLRTARPGDRTRVAGELSDLVVQVRSWLPIQQRTVPLLVDRDRVEVPRDTPLGSGPLGSLHRFARLDG